MKSGMGSCIELNFSPDFDLKYIEESIKYTVRCTVMSPRLFTFLKFFTFTELKNINIYNFITIVRTVCLLELPTTHENPQRREEEKCQYELV